MKYVETLRRILRDQAGPSIADRFIREWLIRNPENERTSVPVDAPFTQVTAIRLLFEYPFMAICEVIGRETQFPNLAPYVAISDTKASTILILDTDSAKCMAAFKFMGWKFRWNTLSELEEWMEETARSIVAGEVKLGERHGPPRRRNARRKGAARKGQDVRP